MVAPASLVGAMSNSVLRGQLTSCLGVAISICLVAPALAQQPPEMIDLELRAGRTMRVALDHRVTVHKAGQPITGTLVEPVYVYDRIVLPIGSRLTGHIERLEERSKTKRALAMMAGDFSPHPLPILRFDSVLDQDGHSIPLATIVKGGTLRARPQIARNPKSSGEDEQTGRMQQAKEAISAQAHEALALLKDPGKKERLEQIAIDQLPYRPEFLQKGTVYDVEVVSPVSFGTVVPTMAAPPGSAPASDSILTAKLTTSIDSGTTAKGAPIAAVLAQPVFTSDHRLILPEGTTLTGEVTLAKQAQYWHRNGKLRVLFASVQPPTEAAHPLLASLYSVDAGAGDGVTVDEEGGTTIANSKTRFIPPALAVLAVRGSIHQEHELDDDDPGRPVHMESQDNPGAMALGGFFGLGVVGAIVGPIYRPVAIAFSVVGAARTVYRNLIAKGREVKFTADTPIQVRLAPGPSPEK
jgi:hypothetical protein